LQQPYFTFAGLFTEICSQKKAAAVTVNAVLISLRLSQAKQLINKPYKPHQTDIY